MTIQSGTQPRWDPYLLRKGPDFSSFWMDYLEEEEHKLLYVLGHGFDPRMCNGLTTILGYTGKGARDCLLIEFDEGPDSPSTVHKPLVSKNLEILEGVLKGRGKINKVSVQIWAEDGASRRRIGSRSAASVFGSATDFEGYTDVIIDVSAMPRGIYFPLIGKTLYLLDKSESAGPNMYVVVSENAALDRAIRDVGIDDAASYVHGFGGDLEMEADKEIPRVWIPILGEDQGPQLERIHSLVEPDEISPVLPSPSLDPRRGDNLLIEYRELLFDRWLVEPRNFIYASEQNPFEVYRQIYRAVSHYNEALRPLGSCKTVVSALSSKLLSLGALLATYELKDAGMSIGLAHVEPQGYQIDKEDFTGTLSQKTELFTLGLFGDCYAV